MIRATAITILLVGCPLSTAQNAPFDALEASYAQQIRPLVETHCLDCHDTATTKGELDLERFTNLAAIRSDPKTWQKVVEQLENGEMPPRKKNRVQPRAEERAALIAWTKRYLDTEARANAGDPGPVILRRLSNAEYTYTVRDLTGLASLDPLREFPVDSASGEGFTNAGGALVMSPALLEKYLAAGKEIANHAILLPDGIRFSDKTSRADQANQVLAELRAFYLGLTGGDKIDFSYRNQVRGANPEGSGEGRVNLEPYFAALIRNRERLVADPATASTIATEAGLNAKYLGALATLLVPTTTQESFLLDHFRTRLRSATPSDATVLAGEVRAWQDRLWGFQNVGHLGLIRPWQIPVSSVATAREIRVKVEAGTTAVFLSAQSFGDDAVVQWQQPRFERPGRPPILLRDAQRAFEVLNELRPTALASTSKYLAALFELHHDNKRADLKAVAAAHEVEPALLTAWASYLGFEHDGPVEIAGHLTELVAGAGNTEALKGWTLPGVNDYSLLSNDSDQDLKIPGDLNAHKIVVHPRPERWIAVGWMSPITSRVQLAPSIRDAHNNCGNGVSWSFELRRGSRTQVLQSGNVDLGKVADIKPMEDFEIRAGDLVSILIDARDGSHVCDLTEIDLAVRELGGEKRSWSLSGDCANDIHAGNPHPDLLGNLAVWHFYGGMSGDRKTASGVLPGSLLEEWLSTKDAALAQKIAEKIEALLANPLPPGAAKSDAEMHQALTSFDGPLFSVLDAAELAKRRSPSDRASFDLDGNLLESAPSLLQFEVPEALVAGSEFVVRGIVHGSSGPNAVVQLEGGATKPSPVETLRAAEPVVVRADGAAKAGMERAFADFRNLFPAAMCYARIVPADEVVTLLLYHREDEHLARLMLNETQRAELDRLWNELEFISQEPLRLVTAYEQIWQFATQDADPKKFEPLEAPIRERAADFEKKLLAAEPAHLEALIALAPQFYRRPLTDSEAGNLRDLYRRLRKEDLPHEDAIHLTLARLFTAAAFLYKAEKAAPGLEQAPVSNWELATRLSYFLTSSGPDAELRAAAADGTLTEPDALRAQTRRLLRKESARRFAIEFACQWLHIRDFGQLDEKNEKLFPEFAELRHSMSEESIRFFTDFFQHDRSILSLLDADHTFVDAPLAAFYDLPAPKDGWQRVEGLKEHGRGGILGFATTLAKQSGASRTSPILRGNWVYETLLGGITPKPPKDVPQLPEAVPEGLSEREMIARHTADPACAKCHARIDPFGFALEAFNAIGHQRAAPDTSATLPDGATIDGLDGLRTYLLTDRRDTFVRHFCRKLLGYALGRAVQLSDDPLLDEITEQLKQKNYRISLAIEAIVLSPQFREIRGTARP